MLMLRLRTLRRMREFTIYDYHNFIIFAGSKTNLTQALLSREGSGERNAMRLTARGICGREVGVVVGHRYGPALGVHGLG